jgi:hypothetical protein
MTIHDLYARISPWFRQRRLRRLQALLGPIDTLLDVGGYPWCWNDRVVPREKVTLLNVSFPDDVRAASRGFQLVEADGCNLPFPDGAFDVLFSNSVIEHVGTWERQQAFAREARRVGRRLWVQTPAREFFIEPHLIAPFIHWLPRAWQRRLIRNGTVRGWMTRPDAAAVDAFLDEVRLLTFAEMKTLFPDCTILRERFLGLTKSYIAFRPSP